MRLPPGNLAAHNFARAPQANIPRSSFNRSHGHKTTFNAGYLIPVLVDEALPGDTFNLKMTAFARLATPIFPIMDNLWLDSFFFAVPYRLVWDNWEHFNGAQDNPGDGFIEYNIPTATSMAGYSSLTLQDYMGLPTLVGPITHSNLHMRAANLIWNTWFRDENLQDSLVVDMDDGPDDPTNYVLQRRGKRHDYFTSCLPWPQKNEPVDIPLGTTAPVLSNGFSPRFGAVGSPTANYGILTYVGSGTPPSGSLSIQSGAGTIANLTQLAYGSQTGLYADLTDASAATINTLREAFQIQKLYERDARGGTRYVEQIFAHFGVISPDFRLQRPEYLGGGSSPIHINPVAQTSQTSGTPTPITNTPQGNLSAFGTVSAINHGFVKSFVEHCLIIGFVSVRADYTYQQGMNRMWSRSTRFDFYWPALSHIGEQAVLNQEIYFQATTLDPLTFGYQERWAEYRFKPSIITGAFRSNYSVPLDAWHLSQDFGSLPTLGPDFIVENPPMSRIKAVSSEPDFIFDAFFDYKCARPMPVYSVPGLIDHF